VDEGATADIVAASWPRLEALITSAFGSLMALYYVIVHWWVAIAGTSEFALRLPSAIFSTLTIPALYLLGAELFDRRTGAVAAAMMTVNLTAIGYAQEARSYALLVLLVTVSAWFFVRALRRPSLGNCAGYVIFGALSVYAHLFAILVLPAEWLSVWLFKPGRRTIIRLTASAVIFGLLAVPAFAVAMAHASGATDWISPTTVYAVFRFFTIEAGHLGINLAGHPRLYDIHLAAGMLLTLVYAAGIIAALGFAIRGGRYQSELGFVALCAFGPIILTAVVSVVKPLFVSRYLVECEPFIVMLAAAGIMLAGEVIPKRVVFAAVGAILVVGLFDDCLYYACPGWENWRGAVAYVARREQPGDVMIIYRGDARWGVDYYRDRLRNPAEFPVIVYPDWDKMYRVEGHYIDGKTFNRSDQYFESAAAAPHRRVWMVFRETWSPRLGNAEAARAAMEQLARRYGPPKVKKFSGVEVALFAGPGEPAHAP
jgi:mannosyltransferase